MSRRTRSATRSRTGAERSAAWSATRTPIASGSGGGSPVPATASARRSSINAFAQLGSEQTDVVGVSAAVMTPGST